MLDDTRPRLVKLVRDGIGRRLGSQTAVYEPIPDTSEHVTELRKKLLEEVGEYLLEPCEEELADVLAVVRALALVDLRVEWSKITALELAKHGERGGFEDGIGLYLVKTAKGER